MYTIKQYSFDQAHKLGVDIEPSKNSKKKIDVYKDGKFLCSIGSIDYGDYPTFLETKTKEYADNRRRLYKIRHEKNRYKVGTPSYFADNILW